MHFPDCFRTAELFQVDIGHTLDTLGINLGGAADAVQVNTAVFLTGLEGFRPHATFPNHCLDAEPFNDLGLVGFFADGSGRASRHHAVLAVFLQHDRAAMINHAIADHVQVAA